MSGILKLPRLGETMEEGRIVGWLVEEGATFRRGDALVEVETDKTVVEVPALGAGRVLEHLVSEGETVDLGTPLARIEVQGQDWTADRAGAAADEGDGSGAGMPNGAGDGSEDQDGGSPQAGAAPLPDAGKTREIERPSPRPSVHDDGPRRATPLARRLARQYGIDLGRIDGTGRRGRIERRDVERMAGAGIEGPIHVRDLGTSAETPFVLLHGFAGDGSTWAALSAQLVRAGRRVLMPDLPGHGKTVLPAASPEELSAGLGAAVGQRVGDAPVHLVAHSLGAVPAVELAEEGRAASLTLIAPVGLGLEIDRAFLTGLPRARSAGELAHLLGRMVEGPLPLSDAIVADIHAMLVTGRLTALADAFVGEIGQAVSLRSRLATLAQRMPVRLLVGHRDRIIPWQGAVDVSPRIGVHHFPQAGHVVHWEEPVAVRDLLLGIVGPSPA